MAAVSRMDSDANFATEQPDHMGLEDHLANALRENADLLERVKTLENNAKTLQGQNDEVNQALADAHRKIRSSGCTTSSQDVSFDSKAQLVMKEVAHKMSKDRWAETLESQENEILELSQKILELRQEKSNADEKITTLNTQVQTLSKKLSSTKNQETCLQMALEEAKQKHEADQLKIQELEQEVEELGMHSLANMATQSTGIVVQESMGLGGLFGELDDTMSHRESDVSLPAELGSAEACTLKMLRSQVKDLKKENSELRSDLLAAEQAQHELAQQVMTQREDAAAAENKFQRSISEAHSKLASAKAEGERAHHELKRHKTEVVQWKEHAMAAEAGLRQVRFMSGGVETGSRVDATETCSTVSWPEGGWKHDLEDLDSTQTPKEPELQRLKREKNEVEATRNLLLQVLVDSAHPDIENMKQRLLAAPEDNEVKTQCRETLRKLGCDAEAAAQIVEKGARQGRMRQELQEVTNELNRLQLESTCDDKDVVEALYKSDENPIKLADIKQQLIENPTNAQAKSSCEDELQKLGANPEASSALIQEWCQQAKLIEENERLKKDLEALKGAQNIGVDVLSKESVPALEPAKQKLFANPFDNDARAQCKEELIRLGVDPGSVPHLVHELCTQAEQQHELGRLRGEVIELRQEWAQSFEQSKEIDRLKEEVQEVPQLREEVTKLREGAAQQAEQAQEANQLREEVVKLREGAAQQAEQLQEVPRLREEVTKLREGAAQQAEQAQEATQLREEVAKLREGAGQHAVQAQEATQLREEVAKLRQGAAQQAVQAQEATQLREEVAKLREGAAQQAVQAQEATQLREEVAKLRQGAAQQAVQAQEATQLREEVAQLREGSAKQVEQAEDIQRLKQEREEATQLREEVVTLRAGAAQQAEQAQEVMQLREEVGKLRQGSAQQVEQAQEVTQLREEVANLREGAAQQVEQVQEIQKLRQALEVAQVREGSAQQAEQAQTQEIRKLKEELEASKAAKSIGVGVLSKAGTPALEPAKQRLFANPSDLEAKAHCKEQLLSLGVDPAGASHLLGELCSQAEQKQELAQLREEVARLKEPGFHETQVETGAPCCGIRGETGAAARDEGQPEVAQLMEECKQLRQQLASAKKGENVESRGSGGSGGGIGKSPSRSSMKEAKSKSHLPVPRPADTGSAGCPSGPHTPRATQAAKCSTGTMSGDESKDAADLLKLKKKMAILQRENMDYRRVLQDMQEKQNSSSSWWRWPVCCQARPTTEVPVFRTPNASTPATPEDPEDAGVRPVAFRVRVADAD